MAGRSPARFLAPLALIAFAVALVAVISSSPGSGGDDSGPVAPLETRTTRTGEGDGDARERNRRRGRRAQTYTIKPGDTPSGIADAHGISVTRLLELNPDIDPNALTVGDRVRVR